MITAERCAEKLDQMKETLDKIHTQYNALVQIDAAKQDMLPVLEEMVPPEEFAKVKAESDEQHAKVVYIAKRVNAMQLSYQHVERKYQEMIQ